MFRISKLADYGIAVAARLAAGDQPERWCSSAQLAESTGIPEPTVGKVLRRLARAGLVEGRRGPAGGYRLARAPERVSVAELLEALEGPLAVTDCAPGASRDCALSVHCDARPGWSRIHEVVASALRSVSLREMLPETPLVPLRTTPLHGSTRGNAS